MPLPSAQTSAVVTEPHRRGQKNLEGSQDHAPPVGRFFFCLRGCLLLAPPREAGLCGRAAAGEPELPEPGEPRSRRGWSRAGGAPKAGAGPKLSCASGVEILHHLKNPNPPLYIYIYIYVYIYIYISTNSGFPWFPCGAGFCPSTVGRGNHSTSSTSSGENSISGFLHF